MCIVLPLSVTTVFTTAVGHRVLTAFKTTCSILASLQLHGYFPDNTFSACEDFWRFKKNLMHRCQPSHFTRTIWSVRVYCMSVLSIWCSDIRSIIIVVMCCPYFHHKTLLFKHIYLSLTLLVWGWHLHVCMWLITVMVLLVVNELQTIEHITLIGSTVSCWLRFCKFYIVCVAYHNNDHKCAC